MRLIVDAPSTHILSVTTGTRTNTCADYQPRMPTPPYWRGECGPRYQVDANGMSMSEGGDTLGASHDRHRRGPSIDRVSASSGASDIPHLHRTSEQVLQILRPDAHQQYTVIGVHWRESARFDKDRQLTTVEADDGLWEEFCPKMSPP